MLKKTVQLLNDESLGESKWKGETFKAVSQLFLMCME